MPTPDRPARPLPKEFFAVSARRLARSLLGCVLVRELPRGGRLAGRIVETEAYLGVQDRASHAHAGRRSQRNESMYAPGGTAYVYFTYGMHYCMNVVCGPEGVPMAALVRALEPLEGLDAMRRHRSHGDREARDVDLCSGPGKLCQALAIDRALDRWDLTQGRTLWLEEGARRRGERIVLRARVGLGDAGIWKDRPLRYLLAGNRHVSVP